MNVVEFNHYSVMLHETIEQLNINPDGIYVDGTLGGGGHAYEVCSRLKNGHFYGIDQDDAAIAAASARLQPFGDKVTVIRNNYVNAVQGIDGSSEHYHSSRYHALNLHSVFQKGTVEFRMFNSTLHAGKVKTYIQLSLAICSQALTQKKASYERTVSANEKYTFRTWLLRLGMIGDEFKTARKHLLEHLDGNIAWKDPSQIEKQKQRFLERKLEADRLFQAEEITEQNETEEQDFGGMSL